VKDWDGKHISTLSNEMAWKFKNVINNKKNAESDLPWSFNPPPYPLVEFCRWPNIRVFLLLSFNPLFEQVI